MSEKTFELSEIQPTALGQSENVNVETGSKKVIPVSISTLYLRYSNRREQLSLYSGFICSIFSGILSPLSFIFFGEIIDYLNEDRIDFHSIWLTILKFAVTLASSAVFAFFERLLLGYFAEHVVTRFRRTYVKAVLKHDVEYIESISPGRLGQRFSEESSRMVEGLGPGIGLLVRSVSSLFTGIVIGFYYSWELTIYCFIAFPFVSYFGFRFSMGMESYTSLITKEHQEADSVAEETFRNIKTVAALGAEGKFINRYSRIVPFFIIANQKVKECGQYAIKIMKISGIDLGSMASSNQLSSAILFLVAVLLVYNQRSGYPSDLVQNGCMSDTISSVNICFNPTENFTEICHMLCTEITNCWFKSGGKCLVGGEVIIVLNAVLSYFMGIGNSFSSLQVLEKSRVSAAYFIDVIEHADELDAAGKTGTEPQSNGGDIEFKDVHFRYKGRDAMILNGLNLSIREGEMIGLVGESGCGKSTVLKLLMRLYAPSSGHIEWNGTDVSDLSIPWIRDQISYVSQEPVLFSGTIRENIMYGRVGCTEAEMIAAAKLVEADAFIRTFPKGYDTFVGELGTSLSGGQKQRIAIARAFLRKPRILIFDEATSALDTQSERIVQRAIENIRSTSTANGGHLSIVVVAHRLSSIRSCDRIVVIDEGRVAEEGTHESLISKGGIYSGLYQSQENVSSPTPIEKEMKIEKEKEVSVKGQSSCNESDIEKTLEKKGENGSNENAEGIPDEIPPSKMKRISVFSIVRYAGKKSYLLYVGFIGNFLRMFFPPVFAYCSAILQSLLYTPNLDEYRHKTPILICLIFITALLTLVGTSFQWYLHAIVGENLIINLRSQAYEKLITSSVSFFDDERHLPSVLTSRLSIDGRRIRDILDRVATILENIFLIIFCLFLVFSPTGYWKLALIALILSPFLVSMEYLQNMIIFRITEQIDSNLTKKSGELTDYLLNIHTIHAYNLSGPLYDRVMTALEPTDRLTNKRSFRSAIGQGLSLFLPSLYMIVVLAAGSYMIDRGEISFSQMFVVMMSVFMCAQFVGINMAYTPNLKLAQQSSNNFLALLNSRDIQQDERAVVATGRDGDIMFDHVSFAYPTRPEVKILSDISFTIPAGSSVAFVGPSGCGKSTIISLIQRMYHCGSGVISLDGTDINSLNLDWYRAQLGAVNQEPCLFSGTIRDNILMGVNGDVSTEVIEEVCRQALCLDFINEMPDRFETDLGATGKAVSGGQKQRLALARAILREPRVLLLDEATSALDSENQEKFLQALKIWRENRRCTVVTVAHRLSTIVDSDVIFVVNNGNIVGKGTHDELLSNCPFYANLVRGQMEVSNE